MIFARAALAQEPSLTPKQVLKYAKEELLGVDKLPKNGDKVVVNVPKKRTNIDQGKITISTKTETVEVETDDGKKKTGEYYRIIGVTPPDGIQRENFIFHVDDKIPANNIINQDKIDTCILDSGDDIAKIVTKAEEEFTFEMKGHSTKVLRIEIIREGESMKIANAVSEWVSTNDISDNDGVDAESKDVRFAVVYFSHIPMNVVKSIVSSCKTELAKFMSLDLQPDKLSLPNPILKKTPNKDLRPSEAELLPHVNMLDGKNEDEEAQVHGKRPTREDSEDDATLKKRVEEYEAKLKEAKEKADAKKHAVLVSNLLNAHNEAAVVAIDEGDEMDSEVETQQEVEKEAEVEQEKDTQRELDLQILQILKNMDKPDASNDGGMARWWPGACSWPLIKSGVSDVDTANCFEPTIWTKGDNKLGENMRIFRRNEITGIHEQTGVDPSAMYLLSVVAGFVQSVAAERAFAQYDLNVDEALPQFEKFTDMDVVDDDQASKYRENNRNILNAHWKKNGGARPSLAWWETRKVDSADVDFGKKYSSSLRKLTLIPLQDAHLDCRMEAVSEKFGDVEGAGGEGARGLPTVGELMMKFKFSSHAHDQFLCSGGCKASDGAEKDFCKAVDNSDDDMCNGEIDTVDGKDARKNACNKSGKCMYYDFVEEYCESFELEGSCPTPDGCNWNEKDSNCKKSLENLSIQDLNVLEKTEAGIHTKDLTHESTLAKELLQDSKMKAQIIVKDLIKDVTGTNHPADGPPGHVIALEKLNMILAAGMAAYFERREEAAKKENIENSNLWPKKNGLAKSANQWTAGINCEVVPLSEDDLPDSSEKGDGEFEEHVLEIDKRLYSLTSVFLCKQLTKLESLKYRLADFWKGVQLPSSIVAFSALHEELMNALKDFEEDDDRKDKVFLASLFRRFLFRSRAYLVRTQCGQVRTPINADNDRDYLRQLSEDFVGPWWVRDDIPHDPNEWQASFERAMKNLPGRSKAEQRFPPWAKLGVPTKIEGQEDATNLKETSVEMRTWLTSGEFANRLFEGSDIFMTQAFRTWGGDNGRPFNVFHEVFKPIGFVMRESLN